MPVNNNREERARLALITYADKTGSEYPVQAATDLIADILYAVVGPPSRRVKGAATKTLHQALVTYRAADADDQDEPA
jgi:hypothetical protein